MSRLVENKLGKFFIIVSVEKPKLAIETGSGEGTLLTGLVTSILLFID